MSSFLFESCYIYSSLNLDALVNCLTMADHKIWVSVDAIDIDGL